MTIDGRYYTEPELAAKFREMQETIQRLDGENYKLTEKLEEIGTAFNEQVSLAGWYEERVKDLIAELEKVTKQEKECKRLLKAAAEDFRKLGDNGNGCLYTGECGDCPLYKDQASECRCWNRETEALDLIGEETNEN